MLREGIMTGACSPGKEANSLESPGAVPLRAEAWQGQLCAENLLIGN